MEILIDDSLLSGLLYIGMEIHDTAYGFSLVSSDIIINFPSILMLGGPFF